MDGGNGNQPVAQSAPEGPKKDMGQIQVLHEARMASGNLGGRPTVMTEEVLVKLKEAFMFDATDKEACIWAGIGEASLYRYQAENSEFREQKEAWKQNPVLKAKVTIYNNLNNVDIAKWYLERKAKNEFGTRQEITGSAGTDFLVPLIKRLDKTDYTQVAEEAKKAMEAMKPTTPT
ncbi:MAG: hypothetical protein US96_C0055G0009 [Candidatus Woesebacteria bacterium GW2011_GWB1_38_5b]|uniref:Uncharacterized protein n=1 Tax=Candidatus Woesebacteria bacterium GW2011_GWB1_38_5b TaxID=1618569 RepID=A0A0G0KE05_9BACT|nr:MAG: hypothetical protein US96_C0055G0009 [Candidatus Woesebacteria bacterium GW2011_GWB1_38_5b]